MAKYCGKCGAQLDEQTGLCPNCSQNQDGGPQKTEQQNTPKGPNFMAILALLAVVVVVVIVLVIRGCSSDSEGQKSNTTSVTESKTSGSVQQTNSSMMSVNSYPEELSPTTVPTPTPMPAPEYMDIITENEPVAACEETFIMQNGERFGVIDSNGKEIFPCQYTDIFYLHLNKFNPQTFLAVQNKGFYGVYDLDGKEVVPPQYTSIEAAMFNECFFVSNEDGKWGAIDIAGKEVIPFEYKGLNSSAQKNISAMKAINEDGEINTYDIVIYDSSYSIVNQASIETEYSYDAPGFGRGEFFSYGTQIHVEDQFLLTGTFEPAPVATYEQARLIQSDSDTSDRWLFPYFVYIDNNCLVGINAETGEKITSEMLDVPFGTPFINDLDMHLDISTGTPYAVVRMAVAGGDGIQVTKQYVITFGDDPHCFSPDDLGIERSTALIEISESKLPTYNFGPFCNGTAFAMKSDSTLIVIDMEGNVVRTLDTPISNANGCYLLGDCAVLDNNGYIYVVDKEGNTICNADGYSSASRPSGGGPIHLKTLDGSGTEIINALGPYGMPASDGTPSYSYDGSVYLQIDGETAGNYNLFAYHDTLLDKYYLFDNNGVPVDVSEGMTGFFGVTIMEQDGTQLMSEDQTAVYGILESEGRYEIRKIADIKDR